MKVTAVTFQMPLLSGKNGERNWLGLEPIQTTAKLITFLRLSLQGELSLCFSLFFLRCTILDKWGGMDGSFAIIYYQ
jgi:hypothetical protein